MQQRKLGAGGPAVSAIGLGCMSFGGMYGAATTEESLACLDAALAAGITFYDTANVYGMGVSETVLGEWLSTRRPEIVLATKASIVPGPPRRIDNSEAHLRAELEGSLKRLKRDHVELFYIHRRQAEIPVEEVVGTLTRLIEEGKIGGYGLSEVSPATIRRAHAVHPCSAVQSEYSIWSRQPELGVIRACRDLGIAFVPFSPLARGMLSETPLDPASFASHDFRRVNPRFEEPAFSANAAAIDAFRRFCHSRGWTVPAAGMAWVLQRGEEMLPIPGTRSAAHLAEWAKADEIVFTAEDWAEIDRLLPPGFAEGDRYSDGQLKFVERYC